MDEELKKLAATEKERKTYAALINRGLNFTVDRTGLFRRKPRTFHIKQLFLGTMDLVSEAFAKMEIDEVALAEDPIAEGRRLEHLHAREMARIVALAVLNDKWKISLFARFYTSYFLWRINPSKLYQLAMIINTLSNTPDFVNSIRLLSIVRTAPPKADRVEAGLGD